MFQRFNKYFLIIIGLVMSSSYIWLRFMRTRLPKDIPFNLSTLGFVVLFYIIETIYKPLKAFDSFLKGPKDTEGPYLRLMVYLSYKLIYFFRDASLFYFIFAILPRLVLFTALFIDTFWFHLPLLYLQSFIDFW